MLVWRKISKPLNLHNSLHSFTFLESNYNTYSYLQATTKDLKVRSGQSFFRVTLKPRGRGGIGRRIGLKRKLEFSPGNLRCRTAQSLGTLLHGDREPSPARNGPVGVETR